MAKTNTILPVTGAATIVGGATVSLTGTYNTANDSMYASGSGYTFAGIYSGGHISGPFNGPSGPSIFMASASSASNPMTVYAGQFSVNNGDHGALILSTSGNSISVLVYVLPGNQSGQFSGTVQGNNDVVTGAVNYVWRGPLDIPSDIPFLKRRHNSPAELGIPFQDGYTESCLLNHRGKGGCYAIIHGCTQECEWIDC